jgi:hypothetical protein
VPEERGRVRGGLSAPARFSWPLPTIIQSAGRLHEAGLQHGPKGIQSVQVASYLNNDPSDAATFTAQFSKLPDGTNYMSSATVNGEKEHLTIQIQLQWHTPSLAGKITALSQPKLGLPTPYIVWAS